MFIIYIALVSILKGAEMKKTMISILIMMTCLVSLKSQTFKLMGGFSSYGFNQDEKSVKSELVPALGLGIDTQFADERVMIVIDLWASHHNQGFSFFWPQRHYNLVNINFDFLLKYKFAKYSSPYFFFGGSIGLILPTRTNANGDKLNNNKNNLDPLWDYGPVIGAGIELFLSKKYAMIIEGRYRMGVSNLKLEGIKFKDNTLFMSIGFKF